MRKNFFIPRTGDKYNEGFNGARLLIVGSHFYCDIINCQKREKECSSSKEIWKVDHDCPCYRDKEDQKYYCLSNSNEIEIESYLEGGRYPSFSAFTHIMTNVRDHLTEQQKRNFWDSVSFTNYIQHFWKDETTPSYSDNKDLFDNDYEALLDVLEETKPEIVFVWNPSIKDCILEHNELKFIGMINMPVLSVYIFTYKYCDKNTSKQFCNNYDIITDKIEIEWIRELIKKCFKDENILKTIVPTQRKNVTANEEAISDIATLLKRFATKKYIVRMGNRLSFNGLKGIHKEYFFKELCTKFNMPHKYNESFSEMFGYRFGHTKYPNEIKDTDKTTDKKLKEIKAIFNKVRPKRI